MKLRRLFNPAKAFAAGLALCCYSITSNAELPTLGDPTLGSFSTRDEARLGQAFYQSLRANLPFVDDLLPAKSGTTAGDALRRRR